ncbi:MAG: phosphotransferase [Pseudomonadota bacterium]|nr:phosphotransferase [Pseudomonadota bacterium]
MTSSFLCQTCRFVHQYLKFTKRWLLKDACNKLRLQKETGFDYISLVNKVETGIQKAQPILKEIDTKYIDMGGANNLGMLQHFSCTSKTLFYITKLEACHLADRELAFLEWQQHSLEMAERIAPELVCCQRIADSGVCALTMRHLFQSKKYEPEAIIDLYQRMGLLTVKLSELKGARRKGGLLQFELEAKTKITRIIKYIVTQMHLPEAYIQAQQFMDQRKQEFIARPAEFKKIKQFLSDSSYLINDFDFKKHYGLLHGDFKKSNILSDDNGQLRVIDLQYYNYGARLWDMAFFCSKEKDVFEKTFTKLIQPLDLDAVESRIFLFFYILAVLLHVKKSSLNKLLFLKVLPAIHVLNGQAIHNKVKF